MDWQPIETAPKDGTWLLVAWPTVSPEALTSMFFPDRWYLSEYWPDEDDPGPTHWMYLPEIPTEDEGNT